MTIRNISIKLLLPLLSLFAFNGFALCLSNPAQLPSCRYPQGDTWCFRNKPTKPYAFRDSCIKQLNSQKESSRTRVIKANQGAPRNANLHSYEPSVTVRYLLKGKVINVADGDTVTILTKDFLKHKIRLYGIDAPEKGQTYGNRSKQMLAKYAKGKYVIAYCVEKDKYKRDVCILNNESSDINALMVKNGGAWVYKKYYEGRKYYELQEKARLGKLGLWGTTEIKAREVVIIPNKGIKKTTSPQAPWNWRRGYNNNPNAPPVKLSRNKICHKIGTTYYNRVKYYTRYETISDCLKHGRLPKR